MNDGARFKEVTIRGRTFRVKKFGARDGSFIAIKVSAILAPMFKGVDMDALAQGAKSAEDTSVAGIDLFGMVQELGNLSEKDFAYIQEKCLRVCSEQLASGYVPVLHDNGAFGVNDLEDDTLTVMALTAHALFFNLSGFFSESGLGGLFSGLLATPR